MGNLGEEKSFSGHPSQKSATRPSQTSILLAGTCDLSEFLSLCGSQLVYTSTSFGLFELDFCCLCLQLHDIDIMVLVCVCSEESAPAEHAVAMILMFVTLSQCKSMAL